MKYMMMRMMRKAVMIVSEEDDNGDHCYVDHDGALLQEERQGAGAMRARRQGICEQEAVANGYRELGKAAAHAAAHGRNRTFKTAHALGQVRCLSLVLRLLLLSAGSDIGDLLGSQNTRSIIVHHRPSSSIIADRRGPSMLPACQLPPDTLTPYPHACAMDMHMHIPAP